MDLNQITIPSLDIGGSIEFYKKLGHRLIVHTHSRYARFECPNGNSTFSVHQVESLPKGIGVSFYFEVENVLETVSKLISKGINFDEMPEDKTYLWCEARLRDPDGNQIVIYKAGANRKNPPWRIN